MRVFSREFQRCQNQARSETSNRKTSGSPNLNYLSFFIGKIAKISFVPLGKKHRLIKSFGLLMILVFILFFATVSRKSSRFARNHVDEGLLAIAFFVRFFKFRLRSAIFAPIARVRKENSLLGGWLCDWRQGLESLLCEMKLRHFRSTSPQHQAAPSKTKKNVFIAFGAT